jgi:HD superfamily phosphodiesterase
MAKKTVTTDISKTIEFGLEVDKLKGVLRKVRPISKERYENTAEHSWQIALFAMSIARTLELKVDVNAGGCCSEDRGKLIRRALTVTNTPRLLFTGQPFLFGDNF